MTNEKEQRIVQGYIFASNNEYERAKKEQEVIAYIRANSDLTKLKIAIKVYSNLVEKKTFDTIIGYRFLDELRQMIIKQNNALEEHLPYIGVKEQVTLVKERKVDGDEGKRYKRLYDDLRAKQVKWRIINISLLIAIIAMFIFSYLSPNTNDKAYENEILNKYSSWKQELQEKEEELIQREDALNQAN